MFRLTANITIGGWKPFKPNALRYHRSIDNFSDSAMIMVPTLAMIKKTGDQYDNKVLPTGKFFKEGEAVKIECGYDGNNVTRFVGFIKRINFSVPLEIECEGYSYQLRKVELNKTYLNTTVKKILNDLIVGTDIKLSDAIPDIPLPKVIFQHASGVQVLQFFKEKCLLSVYFNFNVLYVGLRALEVKAQVRHRLGWNVVKDNELMFNADKEFATINIQLEKRRADGTKVKHINGPKDGAVKVLKISVVDDDAILKEIAAEQKKRLNNKGYQGKITAFLEPYAEPGMSSSIEDGSYTERSGIYFIESVEGSITSNGGGRQKIGIGFSLT